MSLRFGQFLAKRLKHLKNGSSKGLGREGFEPSKAYSQQIYSLPRLAASVPTPKSGSRLSFVITTAISENGFVKVGTSSCRPGGGL